MKENAKPTDLNALMNQKPAPAGQKPKKPKKKRKIGRWILLAILLVIVGFVVWVLLNGQKTVQTQIISTVATTALEKGEIENSINVSGTVESSDVQKVYSKLSGYPVDEIFVEVSDQVTVGQPLCRLDIASLEAQIRQKEADISSSESAGSASINSAQREYAIAREQLAEERSSQIVSAQSNLDSAENNYNKAQMAYDDSKLLFDLGEISETELEDAGKSIFEAQSAVDEARRALDDAYKTQEDAIKSAADQVQKAQASVNTQGQRVSIEDLQRQIGLAEILSPINGTVTLVNAEKDATPGGLLFVVEDLDNLIIKTKIREYDLPEAKLGLPVRIKTDATGDAEFSGVLSYIAPTAIKSATGDLAEGNTVEFEAEISIDKQNGENPLKAGMNTQMYIITETVNNVFTVAYNSVHQDVDEKEYIFVKEIGVDGKDNIRKIPVVVGVESDYLVEISSPELEEGMMVLDAPSDYLALQKQVGLNSDGSSLPDAGELDPGEEQSEQSADGVASEEPAAGAEENKGE